MKLHINGALVVEGIQDEAYLSSFLDVEIIKTNGYEIPLEEVLYLKELSKIKNIIVLTDSDEAGIKIRERLNNKIPNLINVCVDINKCNKNHKHGVAECEKEEIIKVLQGFIIKSPLKTGNLTTNDLFNLNITGSKSLNLKLLVINKFKLGKCNSKTLLKRLNYRQITLEEIKEAINGN